MPIRARRSQNRMHSFMGGRLADGHEAASAAGKAGGSGPGSPLHVGQLPEDHVAGLGKLRAQDRGLTTQRARIRRGWVIQRRPGHFCLRGISAGLLLNCFRDGARLPEARLRCIIETAPDRRVSRRNNGHGFRPNRDLSYFFSCLWLTLTLPRHVDPGGCAVADIAPDKIGTWKKSRLLTWYSYIRQHFGLPPFIIYQQTVEVCFEPLGPHSSSM